MERDYLLSVANTIWQQILVGGGDISIPMSWGIEKRVAIARRCSNNELRPCLALKVSGLLHQGWVIIALNEGLDTYEILLVNEDGMYDKDGWIKDVYWDELTMTIDNLVERPNWVSDNEYYEKAMADSDKKMGYGKY